MGFEFGYFYFYMKGLLKAGETCLQTDVEWCELDNYVSLFNSEVRSVF